MKNIKNDYCLPDFILWDKNKKKLSMIEQDKPIKVKKHSNKPFKSTLKMNTIKGFLFSKVGKPAYTFNEDNSIVHCDRCYII